MVTLSSGVVSQHGGESVPFPKAAEGITDLDSLQEAIERWVRAGHVNREVAEDLYDSASYGVKHDRMT